MKKINKTIIWAVIVIIIIVLAIWMAIKLGGNKKKEQTSKESITNSTIDVSDEAYKDKKIYEQNGDIIIENPDGAKTIETKSTLENPDLVEATQETKGKYEISEVAVKMEGSSTVITGKVKNKDQNTHKITVQSKFYGEDNRVKGAGSAIIEEIKKGEIKDFTVRIRGDMTKYNHKIEVSYTN